MDKKKAQDFFKRFLFWVFGNTAWDVFRRIVSAIASIASTLYYSNKPQYLEWLDSMNISIIPAVVAMLFGGFVLVFLLVSGVYNAFLWVSKRFKIEEKDSDFAIYDDLKIVKDFEQSYLDETIRHNKKYHKLWVVVQNGKTPVYDCVVELVNLEYKGHPSNNEWKDWACDKKAMKWDVGFEPREGKIDMNPSARKILEIAVAYPRPQERMELSHLDGHSTRGHVLLGEYRVTVRIDGKVLANHVKKEIKPIWYEIIFKYPSYNAYLELTDISEYEPPN